MTYIFIDMLQCARRMVELFGSARHSIYYSAFVARTDTDLPGHPGITLNSLMFDAVERGVQVHMFMNPSLNYGNESPGERATDPRVQIRHVVGDAYIPAQLRDVFGDSYSNHHQKFLMVDGQRIMIGGVGVHPCRAGWLVLNTEPHPYYWHEVGVEIPVTPDMYQWVVNMWGNVFTPPPFPLVAGVTEHQTIVDMIKSAASCIHMEAQLCISTKSTLNQVLPAVARRVARAYVNRTSDTFRFMMLVNTHQPDEHALISTATTVTLDWSLRELMDLTRDLGVPDLFTRERTFIGTLEYRGTHIKVHSNLVIQDGHTMVRSSSNLTDRSLSDRPCDNEVGVVVTGPAVALAQQALWKRYFMMSVDAPHLTPHEAFNFMSDHVGVVSGVRVTSAWVPTWLMKGVMQSVHRLPFFGGVKHVNWVTTE